MLFTPKKRNRDYYRVGMAVLYAFAAVFALSTIGAAILPDDYVHGNRTETAAIFGVLALAALVVGRAFSNIAAAMPNGRRTKR